MYELPQRQLLPISEGAGKSHSTAAGPVADAEISFDAGPCGGVAIRKHALHSKCPSTWLYARGRALSERWVLCFS